MRLCIRLAQARLLDPKYFRAASKKQVSAIEHQLQNFTSDKRRSLEQRNEERVQQNFKLAKKLITTNSYYDTQTLRSEYKNKTLSRRLSNNQTQSPKS